MTNIPFPFADVAWTGEYTNWRGERRMRTLRLISLWYGKTDFHPELGWLIKAEAEDGVVKDFVLTGFQK